MMLRRLWLKLLRFWKSTLPRTLFGRSMLILVTPLVLTLAIGLFIFFDRHWSTTTARLTYSLAGEVSVITDAWVRNPSTDSREYIIDQAQKKLGLIIVHDSIKSSYQKKKTRLLLPAVTNPLRRSLEQTLDQSFSIHPYTDKKDSSWIVVSVELDDGTLTFYVPEKRLFSTTTYVFLLFMLGSGLFLSLIAVIFMRNQIRPIRRLAHAAERFGKGLDTPRFYPSGAREVRQAGHAFMEMSERIQKQMRQRTDMLSGVSHDLRTPLTRLKLHLSMMEQNDDIQAMQHDIDVMEKMIKGYLDFARSEVTEAPLRLDARDIVEQAIADARRHGLNITANPLPSEIVSVVWRRDAMQRVLANILENARLYAHHAWVSMDVQEDDVRITIDDDGKGIPPEEYEHVFKPFRRIDESRNQDIEGTGLGLTIARDIVQSHGGTIQLDTSPQGGLRVIILLPL